MTKKWIIVELNKPVHTGQYLNIITPENRMFEFEITQLNDLDNQPLEQSGLHRLVKISCSRSIPPQSIIQILELPST